VCVIFLFPVILGLADAPLKKAYARYLILSHPVQAEIFKNTVGAKINPAGSGRGLFSLSPTASSGSGFAGVSFPVVAVYEAGYPM